MALQYIVIYSFTFHGKWRFQPINLLYFPELVRDVLPINLWHDYQEWGMSQQLMCHLKRMRVSREVSRILAIFIVSQGVHICGVTVPVVSWVLLCALIQIQSYWGKRTKWIGNAAVIRYRKFEEYILSKDYMTGLSPERYRHYLMKNYSTLTDEMLLAILRNYCHALRNAQVHSEDIQLIHTILEILRKELYQKKIQEFILFSYTRFIVGFLGATQKNRLSDISRDQLMYLKSDVVGFNPLLVGKHIVKIDHFLEFLKWKDLSKITPQDYLINMPYIFEKQTWLDSV